MNDSVKKTLEQSVPEIQTASASATADFRLKLGIVWGRLL
jgi:hypothetical protein